MLFMTTKKNLQNIFSCLESDLIERPVTVCPVMLADLCGEYLILLCPLSIKALEEDRYQRLTEHSALDKANEYNWLKADIVLVSDGLFKIKNKLIDSMQSLNSNTRLFGINVSHLNSSSFGDICHQTFTLDNV